MNEQYKSLYDFLGKPAGPELGAQVAAAAVAQSIPLQEKQINNPKYTGKVLMYPVSFLENYFNGPNTISGKQLLCDHKLPF